MIRRGVVSGVLWLMVAALAPAQDDPARYRSETAAGRLGNLDEWPEFEVLAVQPGQWTVSARELQTGEEFKFRVPPQSFRGQVFTADLAGVGEGNPVDVQGPPEARVEQAVVEAPLVQGSGGGFGRGSDTGGMRRQPPPRTDFSPRNPYPRAGGGGGKGSGPMQYRVDSFDPADWVVTARGGDGSTVELKIDPNAFVGYRFKAPVRSLRSGEGFAILALNQKPIESCCTLVKGGARR